MDVDLARVHGETEPGLPSHGVTEISGPPGTGKTSILLALVVDALMSGLKVWWLSCEYRPLPIERLRSQTNYDASFDSMIQVQYLESIEQFLVVQPPPGVEFVVVEHCDTFVPVLQPSPHQRTRRTLSIQSITRRLNEWASSRCIAATTTSIPKLEHADDIYRKMLSVFEGKTPQNFGRIQLYHDDLGYASVGGAHFQVFNDGISTPDNLPETTMSDRTSDESSPSIQRSYLTHSPTSVESFLSLPPNKKPKVSADRSSPPPDFTIESNTDCHDSDYPEQDLTIPNSQLEYQDVPLDQ